MAFTFVHAADLHLDSPFRAVRADARLMALLQESTFRALAAVVDLAVGQQAAFVVLAGDLFDAKDRSVRARLALRRELARLDAAGIRTFIVHGNHDPLGGEARIGLPPSVKVFGTEWEEVLVELPSGDRCRVQGISYPQERVTENLSRRFLRQGPEFTVGVLHANVGGDSGHANYAPCSLTDLADRGLDYWALGHVHTRAEYPLATGGVAVFPGNPQGRHANETGERGCVLVRVDGGRCTRTFVAVDRVRWHRLAVDVSGCGDIGAVADAVERSVDSACPDGFDAHAARVLLEGRGGPHAELADADALTQLQSELGERLAARNPPVLLESLEDRTGPLMELARVRQDGGLAAEVLEVADAAMRVDAGRAALWDGELDTLDARLKRAGLVPTRERAGALIDRASLRAVELLGEGG